MNDETPTFCKGNAVKNTGNSFSIACDSVKDPIVRESYSFKQFKKGCSIQVNKKSKFLYEIGNKDYRQDKRKYHLSHKNTIKKYDINNIIDFIKHHKFKLRNDFDKKHVEKFLSSKEEAFTIPFLSMEELSSTTMKS